MTKNEIIIQGIKNCEMVAKHNDNYENLIHKNLKMQVICLGYDKDIPKERCKDCVFNQFYDGVY